MNEFLSVARWAFVAYAFFTMFVGGLVLAFAGVILYHLAKGWKS